MTITNGYATLAEIKDRLLQQRVYTAATIAFVATGSKITDTAWGLERFSEAHLIRVSGSTGNSKTFTVVSVAHAEIVVAESVAGEVAGPSVTITNISDTFDDAALEGAVEAASRKIDQETGRTFYSRTETHYYPTPTGRTLTVPDDDLISITTLTNGDAVTIANTEYDLLPRNTTPKYAIQFKRASTLYWAEGTEGIITIAGAWGYSATTPAGVKEACLLLASRFFKRKDAVFGVAGTNAIGEAVMVAKIDPDAQALIQAYRRIF